MRRLLLIALLALAGTCKTNPHTGRSQLLLFSEGEMNQLGTQAYLEMTGPQSGTSIVTSSRYTGPLQEVGGAISVAANRPDYQWEFKLIDDPKTVNAWALPGGKIAFYTGIYPILEDQAGMAIVMGHEVMHAILQHGNERMSQSLTAELVLTAAAIGVLLPYSRKHETEADEQGLYLAARAGYDPEAGIGVWQRMAALSAGSRPPEFLSTHPEPGRRIDNMRKWMPKAKQLYDTAPRKMPNWKLPQPPGTAR